MPLRRALGLAVAFSAILAATGQAAPVVTTLHTGLDAAVRLCFDVNGNLYVALREPENRIVKIPAGSGTPVTFATGFDSPGDLAFDSQGNLFVVNFGADRVDKVTPGGTRTVFATGILLPWTIVIDAQDNLFVGEYETQAVKKITPSGTVTHYQFAGLGTISGLPRRLTALLLEPDGSMLCGTFGPGNGLGPFPLTRIPAGGGTRTVIGNSSIPVTDIVRGTDGYHYFAGYQDHVIARSILPSLPQAYAGSLNVSGLVDGPLLTARFDHPAGLALSPGGAMFIADFFNDAVRVMDTADQTDRSTWGRLKGLYRR